MSKSQLEKRERTLTLVAVKDDLLGACKPLGNDIGAQVTLCTSLVERQTRDTRHHRRRHEILLAVRLKSEGDATVSKTQI